MAGPRLRIQQPIPPPGAAVSRSPDRPPPESPGTGARVWLLRHAEVQERWHDVAYGNLDVPLSERGLSQTRALIEAFRTARGDVALQRVTSSPLARALELGRGLSEATGAELVIDARLAEIDRGAWQGLPASEFRARWEREAEAFFADPWRWKGHRGESDEDLFLRAWPAFEEVARSAAGRAAAISAHSNVIRVLLGRLLGKSALESYAIQVDPAHAMLVADEPEGWVLARANVAGP